MLSKFQAKKKGQPSQFQQVVPNGQILFFVLTFRLFLFFDVIFDVCTVSVRLKNANVNKQQRCTSPDPPWVNPLNQEEVGIQFVISCRACKNRNEWRRQACDSDIELENITSPVVVPHNEPH